MVAIPIHLIAFFLATLLLPAGVGQFAVKVHDTTIQWTRQETGWHAVELPRDDWGMYSVKESVVTVAAEGKASRTDIKQFLSIPAQVDMTTVTEIPTARDFLGTAIQIKREKNKITLSQSQGALFKEPVTITWPDREEARTIELLRIALDAFKADTGSYPTTEEGLEALVTAPPNARNWRGPYLHGGVPLDPWGKPYLYKHPTYDLFSSGPDGREGGDDDVGLGQIQYRVYRQER